MQHFSGNQKIVTCSFHNSTFSSAFFQNPSTYYLLLYQHFSFYIVARHCSLQCSYHLHTTAITQIQTCMKIALESNVTCWVDVYFNSSLLEKCLSKSLINSIEIKERISTLLFTKKTNRCDSQFMLLIISITGLAVVEVHL